MTIKRALITGGAGFLGTQYITNLLTTPIETIIALTHTEESLRTLQTTITDKRLIYCLGDIKDAQAIRLICRKWTPDLIIHTAALKHVSYCEQYPLEATKTNIIGTLNIIEAAQEINAQLIAISSDKVVRPTSTYGITKMAMERIVTTSGGTCIRSGNILGSTGSVLQIWKEQAAKNEPLKITNPLMTRFWITRNDLANFTIRAATVAKGGETYIPKIKACSIGAIANTISNSQQIYGQQPGERTHELLLAPEETVEDQEWAFVIKTGAQPYGKFYQSDTAQQIDPQELICQPW